MPTLTVYQQGSAREIAFEGSPLLSALLAETGIFVPQPCGGRGRCGKCAVTISGQVSPPNALEEQAGRRLACQARLLGDCELHLQSQPAIAQIQTEGARRIHRLSPLPGRYGAAIDLGTTTMALRLYDLSNGNLLTSATCVNPQAAVAADVMSRIDAALQGQLGRLQQMALDALSGLLAEACQEANIHSNEVDSLVIAGNTTMLYLLTGTSPHSLARAPFLADTLFGSWHEILGHQAYLPHCMNAFVGADISCAVLASGMTRQAHTALLVDVGTNGELALWKDGQLYVASTAAGPAFEGAGIFMGCGSQLGAVDSVWVEDGKLQAHTIGSVPAVGICGSGLLDAVAVLLDLGLVDETGAMEAEQAVIVDTVVLLPRDIRAVQLAKAAIAAGIHILLQHAHIQIEDIDTFYIAGGFGSHLDLHSAARIGMIPPTFLNKAQVIGNAALDGAAMLLLNEHEIDHIAAITQASVHVALGGNPLFNEAFMEGMLFPEM